MQTDRHKFIQLLIYCSLQGAPYLHGVGTVWLEKAESYDSDNVATDKANLIRDTKDESPHEVLVI
jgi:hypothetical protein